MNGWTLITSTGSNLSSVSFDFIITFTALGSFSVDNPITASVTLNSVSLPNFLDVYQVVGFSNAYDWPFKYNAEGSVNSSKIFLQSMGNDTYKGTGTIVWMLEGDAYGPIVFPENVGISLPTKSVQELPYVLRISGVSDTLTQTYSESTLKVGLLLSSFSFLILQPVIEAIVLNTDDKK